MGTRSLARFLIGMSLVVGLTTEDPELRAVAVFAAAVSIAALVEARPRKGHHDRHHD